MTLRFGMFELHGNETCDLMEVHLLLSHYHLAKPIGINYVLDLALSFLTAFLCNYAKYSYQDESN